ncbi:hypothetical protein HYT26_04975 [Candidatus Pacearchaeota archaeon]|nr:hypothetical protein [Candidatus Pacearchaeota archaeon]
MIDIDKNLAHAWVYLSFAKAIFSLGIGIIIFFAIYYHYKNKIRKRKQDALRDL